MKFSKSELIVMEVLWEPGTLDGNGEIMASDLSAILTERFGWPKTSNYSFFNRLLKKGAITRRYPKYTMKPLVFRDEVGTKQTEELIDNVFKGSIVNLFQALLDKDKISKDELCEIKKMIQDYC